jgi:hypothetical protein
LAALPGEAFAMQRRCASSTSPPPGRRISKIQGVGDVLADAHFGIYKINGTATSLRVASMRMPISGIYKINGTALSLRVASMRRAPISAPMRMHISGIYKINGTAMSLRMATSGIYEINGTAMPISGLCG